MEATSRDKRDIEGNVNLTGSPLCTWRLFHQPPAGGLKARGDASPEVDEAVRRETL